MVERLGFLDPFGAVTGTTTGALTFNTTASTRVRDNSFQGYSSGTAIQFNGGASNLYSQFVEVTDNVCLSVKSCVVMNGGITNPAWIERNRCVSAQFGGGRCVQLGPNVPNTPPLNGGATNWVVENFALYFPISYESMDQYADYWIGNSNQQTADLQNMGHPIPNIIGLSGSGVALHIGASASGTGLCFDNEILGGNSALNDVALFIDPKCDSTLYLGYTLANASHPLADFGTQSTFWNQELGMSVSAPSGVNPLTVQNSSGSTAWQVLPSGSFKFLGSGSWMYCAKGDFPKASQEMATAISTAPDGQKAPLQGLAKRLEDKQDINK